MLLFGFLSIINEKHTAVIIIIQNLEFKTSKNKNKSRNKNKYIRTERKFWFIIYFYISGSIQLTGVKFSETTKNNLDLTINF